MASVVESKSLGSGSFITLTVTMDESPIAGDVLVVVYQSIRGTPRTVSSVGGSVGGSWSAERTDVRTAIWVNESPASDGTVEVTQSGIGTARIEAFLIRGATAAYDHDSATTTGTSLSGPSLNAGNGQVAIFAGITMAGTLTHPSSPTPSGDWTTGTPYTATGTASVAHRVPTGAATAHQAPVSSATSAALEVVGLVVGEESAPAAPMAESPSPIASSATPVITTRAESPSPIGSTVGPPVVVRATSRSRIDSIVGPFGSGSVAYPTTTVYAKSPSPVESKAVPSLQPAPVPSTITDWPVIVEAHTMPALSEAQQRFTPFVDYQPITGVAGRYRVFVDGQDVTFLRDVPTIVEDYSSSDPFGDKAARFVCKQINEWDELGAGDLSMFDMDSDPAVDIAFEDESGNLTHLWDGFLASHGDDATSNDKGRTFTAEGTLKQASHWPWTPPVYMEPTDPGVLFARIMNSLPNRRYAAFVEVETGLPPVVHRGSQNQSILDAALEVLAMMTAADGRQWAPIKQGPRNYQLGLKPALDTYDAAIVKGAEGVDVRLVEDESMRVDGYFGQGIAPNGGQWGNYYFPGLDLFVPPPYPYSDTTQTIYLGDTDAGTDTGDGVSVAQGRLVELGYAVAVDGTYNSADAAAVTQMQRDFGLLVDGRIGPQTWSSLFSPGVNEVDLGRIRLPLVSKPWVMEYLYAANGAIAGPNPAYDPDRIPHMPNVNFGSDITKAEATVLARKMLETNGDAVWVGSIDLLTDLVAPDGVTAISRFLVREGWRIKIIGHDGDVIVRAGEASKDGLSVRLVVDEKARDALTLDAIAERDREARRYVKPRPGSPSKISQLMRDHIVQFEDESKAGKIPAYPVNGNAGLWSVFPIFVQQTGRIAKFEMSARNVKTTFVVALFGKPIQPQVLASYVPDPIASGEGWRDHERTLVLDHGWIDTYGQPGALGGYAPRVQSDGGPITGDLYDDSGLEFESQVGGYVWMAVFASASCNVSGRAFPAVPQ